MKRRILSALLAAGMIFGCLGSAAFASYNEKYDINGDGFVNPKDALYLLEKFLDDTTTASDDVNGDGSVNPKDALVILEYFLDPSAFDDSSDKSDTSSDNSSDTSSDTSDTSSDTPSDISEEYRKEVVRLVNIEREKYGLSPLAINEAAAETAQLRAGEIIELFSHERPNGDMCYTALNEAGIRYRTAGENIAAGQPTPASVVDAWMNSPGHRSNILNSNFTEIGVGYIYDGNSYYGSYWVQMFIG